MRIQTVNDPRIILDLSMHEALALRAMLQNPTCEYPSDDIEKVREVIYKSLDATLEKFE